MVVEGGKEGERKEGWMNMSAGRNRKERKEGRREVV